MSRARGRSERAEERTEELVYRVVDAATRRFHLSLSRNVGGLFLRIAAARVGQDRVRVIVPGELLHDFIDTLEQAVDAARAAPAAPDAGTPVFSERLGGVKTFFIDVKDNDRGRFVRLSQVSTGGRATIIIPEEVFDQVLREVREMVETHADEVEREVRAVEALPRSHTISTRLKRLYMDWEAGRYGRYLRLTDHTGAKRSSVIIPEEMLRELYDELGQIISEMGRAPTA